MRATPLSKRYLLTNVSHSAFLVRQQLKLWWKKAFEEPGNGRVLVVDGGGSMRCAMLGDMIAEAGTKNGWSGIVIYGCIRDSKMIGGTSSSTRAIMCNSTSSSIYST
jgi:RraA family protein